MVAVEVTFRYNGTLTESNLQAIDSLREVYGIRRVRFNENESAVRVEYDASRFNEDGVARLLGQAGIDLGDEPAFIGF